MKVLTTSYRQRYIQALFPKVASLRYSYLKFFYLTLSDIPEHSDIDLLIDRHELMIWKKLLAKSPFVKRIQFVEKSFACYVKIYFTDLSYLEIDLIHTIKWKSKVYMHADNILSNAQTHPSGVKIARAEDAFSYLILFYSLNKKTVPPKYQDYFDLLEKEEKDSVISQLSETYKLPGLSRKELFHLSKYQKQLKQAVSKLGVNRGLNGLIMRINALFDPFKASQPTITFSGVDGVGKTTVLELTSKLLEEKYRRKVVLLRQRPSILPILSSFKYGKESAKKRAADNLPRTGSNSSRISSLLRFGWYYLDFFFGQWKIWLTVNRRNRILLYDRYYFDFIADPKRANLMGITGFIRPLYAFVFKPELNFLLYADPEVILARKQELSEEDIRQLTASYSHLFDQLNTQSKQSQYIKINNVDLDETMDKIEKALVDAIGN